MNQVKTKLFTYTTASFSADRSISSHPNTNHISAGSPNAIGSLVAAVDWEWWKTSRTCASLVGFQTYREK